MLKKKIFIIFFLIIINIFFLYIFLNKRAYDEIIFLDVGQGSSVLIKTKEGKNILIDSGGNNKAVKSYSSEVSFFDRNINAIFITHYDIDHSGMVPYFLKNYKVNIFADSGILEKNGDSQEPLFNFIKKIYKEEKITKDFFKAGDIFEIEKDIKVEILYPFSKKNSQNMKSNSDSVVFLIWVGNRKILITGDLPQKQEKFLVKKYGEYLKSDILMAGHHGSKTSSSDIFLKKVSPKYFVISSGINNSYGHPSFEVIQRAKNLGLKILRTDKLGSISFDFINQKIILKE